MRKKMFVFRDNVYITAVVTGAWLLMHWSLFVEPHHTVHLPHLLQALAAPVMSGAAFTSSGIPVATILPYIQTVVSLPVALRTLRMGLSARGSANRSLSSVVLTIPERLDSASLVAFGMCVGTCAMAALYVLHEVLPAFVKTVTFFGCGLFLSLNASWLIVGWTHGDGSKTSWATIPLAVRVVSYLGPLGLWVFLAAGLALLGPPH
jgi:hypothetical protein